MTQIWFWFDLVGCVSCVVRKVPLWTAVRVVVGYG